MTRAVEELARRLSRVERNIRAVGSTPQLAYSSIEDGNLQEYTADGTLVQVIGQQFDGTSTTAQFNGATPPSPLTPALTARVGAIQVNWDGGFVGGAVAPMDFARVDVYASITGSSFTPSPGNRVGSFMSATGGNITFAGGASFTYWVKLVTVSQSGKLSAESPVGAGIKPLGQDSDGVAPAAMGSAPTVVGGIGALFVRWTPVTNQSRVKYNVYASTNSSFLADGSSFIGTTEASQFTIRQLTGGVALQYGIPYYVKVWVEDADGFASGPSPIGNGQMMQVSGPDVAASYVYAGTVVADQIIGGSLAAEVTLSGLIRTATAGQRVELGPFGLIIYDSAGNPATVLAPDSSTFRGDVEAAGFTATGPAAFRSSVELAKATVTTLASATSSPPSAPNVVVNWPSVNLDFGGWWANGLHFYSSKWWVAQDLASGPRASSYLTTGGAGAGFLDLGVGATIRPHPWGGLVHVGASWYTLGWAADSNGYAVYYITKYNDSTGAQEAQVTYAPLGSGLASNTQLDMAIGTDGTNVLIAERDTTGPKFRIQVRNPSTLAVNSTFNTATNSGFTGPVISVGRHTGDWSGSRYWVLTGTGQHVWVFDGTTGAYNSTEAFRIPAAGSMRAIAWDGTRFHSRTTGSGSADPIKIYKHSTDQWATGGSSETRYATTTWRNITSSYETSMSPQRSYAMEKRAWATVTTAAIPANAEQPGFYLSKTGGVRTNFWRQSGAVNGVNTLQIGDGATFAGTNPPATSNFPNETPAAIQSGAVWAADSLPAIDLRGDGTGRTGPEVQYGATYVKTSADQDLNSTSFSACTDFAFAALVGNYEVEVNMLMTSAATASGVQFGWTMPASSSFNGGGTGPGVGQGPTHPVTGAYPYVAGAVAGTLNFGTPAGATAHGQPNFYHMKFRIVVGTAGTCNLRFANIAASGIIRIKQGGWMTVRRLP